MAKKRVYHFCNETYGLENLKKKRLKVATIHDLNDPFELLSHKLPEIGLRGTVVSLKNDVAEKIGLLCFSTSYDSPVQWAHYSDKHRGVCLGFDIDEDDLLSVKYRSTRLRTPREHKFDEQAQKKWLEDFVSTKYSHWKYEKEQRVFVNLSGLDKTDTIFFQPISERIRLRQVIVGCRSNISRSEMASALSGYEDVVEVFKARMAFNSFRIVRNRSEKLWL